MTSRLDRAYDLREKVDEAARAYGRANYRSGAAGTVLTDLEKGRYARFLDALNELVDLAGRSDRELDLAARYASKRPESGPDSDDLPHSMVWGDGLSRCEVCGAESDDGESLPLLPCSGPRRVGASSQARSSRTSCGA